MRVRRGAGGKAPAPSVPSWQDSSSERTIAETDSFRTTVVSEEGNLTHACILQAHVSDTCVGGRGYTRPHAGTSHGESQSSKRDEGIDVEECTLQTRGADTHTDTHAQVINQQCKAVAVAVASPKPRHTALEEVKRKSVQATARFASHGVRVLQAVTLHDAWYGISL